MFVTIHGTPGQIRQFEEDMPCSADELMERCLVALEMFPDNLHADIYLYDTVDGVRKAYQERYGKPCDYLCWMSKSRRDVHIAVSRFDFGMLAHEFGHVIVETAAPGLSYKCHEVVAQVCARDVV